MHGKRPIIQMTTKHLDEQQRADIQEAFKKSPDMIERKNAEGHHQPPVPQQSPCEMWVRVGVVDADPDADTSEISMTGSVMFRGSLAHMGEVRDFMGTFEKLWPKMRKSAERELAERFRQQVLEDKKGGQQ